MRSLAFILLLAACSSAFAQSAARKVKRPAASLSADQDETQLAPVKVRPQPADLCGDADRALGVGLAYAFEQAPEEIRVLAVEDLGLLGDARALDALATLVLDANPRVQSAALRAASQFTTLRATQILENVVRHPRLPAELKLQALHLLPFQRRDRVRTFLAAVTKAPGYNPALRQAAQQSLNVFDAGGSEPGASK